MRANHSRLESRQVLGLVRGPSAAVLFDQSAGAAALLAIRAAVGVGDGVLVSSEAMRRARVRPAAARGGDALERLRAESFRPVELAASRHHGAAGGRVR
jgi:hypothetical protein